MNNLYPTIVIGLGTFGGMVVSNLRTLVYEELGVAGLPIYRFLHISTHKADEVVPRPANQETSHPWESLQVIHATIPAEDKERLSHLLDEKNPLSKKEPGWKEWLNPILLRIPADSWEAGAGWSRMVGRCCLWNNWNRKEHVKTKLSNAIQQVVLPKSASETNAELRKYYERKTGQTPDTDASFVKEGSPKVYIIGSLCGGTSSGMFLDIAYFFRTYEGQRFDIFGVFAVPDQYTCDSSGKQRLAANALGALIELDFFMHKDTRYEALFPGDRMPAKSTDLPFRYTQLISPSSRSFTVGRLALANEETMRELSYICATSMFFELLSGAEGRKSQIKINYYLENDKWGRPRDKGPGYLKALSSFGAATAHYPKYRIAGAAACRIVQEKILEWMGRVFEEDPMTKRMVIKEKPRDERQTFELAKKWSDAAYRGCTEIIAPGTSGRGNLRQEWQSEFNSLFPTRSLAIGTNSQDLRQKLEQEPQDNPLSCRFMSGSTYARMIRARMPQYQESMVSKLKEMVNQSLKVVLGERAGESEFTASSLFQIKEVIDVLIDNILNDRIGAAPSLPTEPVRAGFLDDVLREFARAENSRSVHLTWLSNRVGKYYGKMVVDAYRMRLDQEHDRLEDACIGEILPGLQEDLRIQLRNPMVRLLERMQACFDLLEEQFNDLTSLESWDNMIVVLRNRTEGILGDIKQCRKLFQPYMWAGVFEAIERTDDKGLTIKERLLDPEEDHRKIINLLTDQVTRKVMASIDVRAFDIVNELIRFYGQKLANLAQRSEVLMQTVSDYDDVFQEHPRLICGGKPRALTDLKGHLEKHKVENFNKVSETDTAMDHMLHFYQEEGGVALDELMTYELMDAHYRDCLESTQPEMRLLHTDKDPSNFDITRYKRFGDLKDDRGEGKPSFMRVAFKFAPDLIFDIKPVLGGKDEQYFEWDDNGMRYDATYDPEDPDSFLWELARSPAGCNRFKEKIRRVLESLSEDEMIGRWNALRERIKNKNELEDFEKYFNGDFVKRTNLPWW